MQTYKLIPQFRENCIIEGKEEGLFEFTAGDIIFLILNTPAKKFSIISKIEAINYADEQRIYIDKRIMEEFGESDEVNILKYNPAEAIEVHISISEEYGIISKGEWTSIIKPSLLNKVIDLGQEVTFLVPWEGGAPIVVTGIITSTLPNPPVYIGKQTKLFLYKRNDMELSAIKRTNLNIKRARVDILDKQIKCEILHKIKEIKQQNYPSKGIKYSFKATNPKHLFISVLNLFKGLEIIEEANENQYHIEQQDYLASAVFLLESIPDSFQIIDIQIIATENSGILLLWITGKTEDIIFKTLEKYDSQIQQLKHGLEQKAEILSIKCPECGGTLPIESIDVNGLVECSYCGKISKIPKFLRY